MAGDAILSLRHIRVDHIRDSHIRETRIWLAQIRKTLRNKI
jgi:hypothetical protein